MFLQTNFSFQASASSPSSASNFISPAQHSTAFSPASRPPPSVSPQYHLSHPHPHPSPHNPFGFHAEERNFADNAQLAFDAAPLPVVKQQPQGRFGGPKVKKNKGPKGYVSGFNFFAIRIRNKEDLQDQLQHLTNNEINKMIGQMWKALPKTDKTAFYDLAEGDKLRYLRDVHEHNQTFGGALVPKIDPPPGYDLSGQPLPEDLCPPPFQPGLSSSPRSAAASLAQHRKQQQQQLKQKRGRKADPERNGALRHATTVQRPRTSYSIFAHQEKDFLSGLKCPDLQRKMGKYLGLRWKNMCPAEKRMYDLLAASGATINKKQRV